MSSDLFCMILATQLGLSRFDGAPLGYLICITLVSCHAIIGVAQMIVRIAPMKSRLLPMISAIGSMALTVTSMILTLLLYPNDGDWPIALSLIPFFAQSRSVYLVLVNHGPSYEVDVSLAFLFMVGTLSLMFTLITETELDIPFWTRQLKAIRNALIGSPSSTNETAGDIEMRVQTNHHANANSPSEVYEAAAEEEIDDDVVVENERARAYDPIGGRISDNACAIVVKDLVQIFPAQGGQPENRAVSNVNLALSFGECFALLGPNGAGMRLLLLLLLHVFL